MEMTSEGCAAERAYLAQSSRIDEDLSLAVVFLLKQIDQLPGGVAAEVPFGVYVQVAINLPELNPEAVVHILSS